MRGEDLETTICVKGPTYDTELRVEIKADGDQWERFEAVRDAVHDALDGGDGE